MSKRRVQSDGCKALPARKSANLKEAGIVRFIGISLSGGKNSKTVVTVLDYYPSAKRLVLSHLIESLRSEDDVSGDDALLESIIGFGSSVQRIAFDVPLSLPKCAVCQLKCPGIVRCQEPHIRWFWKHHEAAKEQNRNVRLFTPYTQRPVEAWLSQNEDCEVSPSDALGANAAPLTARAIFLKKRLPHGQLLEVNPRLSLLRLGRRLKLMKRHLRFHKNSIEGERSRSYILSKWMDQSVCFIYHQDQVRLILNSHAFDSLVCALTAYEDFCGRVEVRPKDFPKSESFLSVPVSEAHTEAASES